MAYNPIFRRTHSTTSGFVYYARGAQVDFDTYETLWEEHLRVAEEEVVRITTLATYRDHSPGAHYEIGGWYQEDTYTKESHMRTMWLHIHENAVRADDFMIRDHGEGLWSAETEVWLPRPMFMALELFISPPSTIYNIVFDVE